jgi:hypothetical protein
MSAPFSSGDLLAMRRFPLQPFGPSVTTVWHRRSDGAWTIYADRPLDTSPRYSLSALAPTVETPIELSWSGAKPTRVSVRAGALSWTVELEQNATTRLKNAIGWLGISGHVSDDHIPLANPMIAWVITSSEATIDGRNLGRLSPRPQELHLGGFWIPPRDLLAFGHAFFEPHARRRT